MSNDARGVAICEPVRELAFRNHLRQLAEHRDRKAAMKKAKKKKEACTGGAAQTSQDLSVNKTYNHYSGNEEVCQHPRKQRGVEV